MFKYNQSVQVTVFFYNTKPKEGGCMHIDEAQLPLFREVDRLLVFCRCWNLLKFTPTTLRKLGFVPEELAIEELVEQSLKKGMVRYNKSGDYYHFSEYLKSRWARIWSDRCPQRWPFLLCNLSFFDLVNFGDEEAPERSSLSVAIVILRENWRLLKFYFQKITQAGCFWSDETKTVFRPDTIRFDSLNPELFSLFFSLLIDLSVIVPVIKTDGGYLWKVMKRRAKEISQAVRYPWYTPEGFGLESSSLVDVFFASFHGVELVTSEGKSLDISAVRYRLILRHLSGIDMFSFGQNNLPVAGDIAPLLVELAEAGLVSRKGRVQVNSTYLVRREKVVEVLTAIYSPNQIPRLFGTKDDLGIVVSSGPTDTVDARWECRENKKEELKKERVIRSQRVIDSIETVTMESRGCFGSWNKGFSSSEAKMDESVFKTGAIEVLRRFWSHPREDSFTPPRVQEALEGKIPVNSAAALLAEMKRVGFLEQCGSEGRATPKYAIVHYNRTVQDMALMAGFMQGVDRIQDLIEGAKGVLPRLQKTILKNSANPPRRSRPKPW